MSPDVVSLVSTDQNGWSERTKGPCACHGTVLYLASKDHAYGRLPLEKNLMNTIDRRKYTVLS